MINLDSTSPGPAARPLWWKPPQTFPIPYGFRCGPTPSPAARPISAIPSGPIIITVSTASARREARGAIEKQQHERTIRETSKLDCESHLPEHQAHAVKSRLRQKAAAAAVAVGAARRGASPIHLHDQ